MWEASSEPGKVPPLMNHLWDYLSQVQGSEGCGGGLASQGLLGRQ